MIFNQSTYTLLLVKYYISVNAEAFIIQGLINIMRGKILSSPQENMRF